MRERGGHRLCSRVLLYCIACTTVVVRHLRLPCGRLSVTVGLADLLEKLDRLRVVHVVTVAHCILQWKHVPESQSQMDLLVTIHALHSSLWCCSCCAQLLSTTVGASRMLSWATPLNSFWLQCSTALTHPSLENSLTLHSHCFKSRIGTPGETVLVYTIHQAKQLHKDSKHWCTCTWNQEADKRAKLCLGRAGMLLMRPHALLWPCTVTIQT